jgi:hypothetical protein
MNWEKFREDNFNLLNKENPTVKDTLILFNRFLCALERDRKRRKKKAK